MKRIFFLLIAIFSSLYSIAQEPISNVVTVTVPKQAVRLNKDQFLERKRQTFNLHSSSPDKDNRLYQNTYNIDGVLMSFYDLEISPIDNRSLQRIEREMTGLIRSDEDKTVNYSKIITINNIQFYILEYSEKDEFTTVFISEKRNGKIITGNLKFKKPDEEKAQKALDTLLGSMHFKQ